MQWMVHHLKLSGHKSLNKGDFTGDFVLFLKKMFSFCFASNIILAEEMPCSPFGVAFTFGHYRDCVVS